MKTEMPEVQMTDSDGSGKAQILYISSDTISKEISSLEFASTECEMIFSSSFADALEKSFTYSPALIVSNIESEETDIVRFLSILHKICANSIFLVFVSQKQKEEFKHDYEWIWGIFDTSQVESVFRREIPKIINSIKSRVSDPKLSDQESESVISELEWLVWKETSKSADGNFLGRNIIDNLTHTLSQGLGIGSLISRLEVAEVFMKKETEYFRIPKNLMNSILEDKNHLRERNENLDKFKTLFDLKITKERIHSLEINSLVKDILDELREIACLKTQKIIHDDHCPDVYLLTQSDFLLFGIKELYVNAMKFSPEGSEIRSSFLNAKNHFIFRVVNDISHIEGGVTGIPEEFSFRLFEPFFKLNNIFDERFYNLEFGMGMGLNLLQSLAKQSDCKVSISEIVEESTPMRGRKVAAELRFPLFYGDSAKLPYLQSI